MTEVRGSLPVPLWRRALGSRGLQLLLALVLLAWLLQAWLASVGGAVALRGRFGLGAAAILVPVQAVVTFVPVLGEALAVTNALLYGFWLGSALSWAAWMWTSWLQYAVVRRTVHDFDMETAYERLPAWFRRFPVEHPVFLIGVRIPLGGPIVNTAAGAFGVPLWRHTWCAAVGLLPRALFFSAAAQVMVGLPPGPAP